MNSNCSSSYDVSGSQLLGPHAITSNYRADLRVSTTCTQRNSGTTLSDLSPQPCSVRPMIQGKIPSSLLTSCKQIYDEARLVPFHTNTFAFVNWFRSGLYAGRHFTYGLKAWQSKAMRWASVEVLGRDLLVKTASTVPTISEKPEKGEWWDLCSMWKGIYGLRLVIKGSSTLHACVFGSISNASDKLEAAANANTLLRTELDWIQAGLLCLTQLQWIEIEIEDEAIGRDAKVSFCKELGKAMEDVKVVLVERIRVDLQDTEFKWIGGAPPGYN